MGHIGGGTLCPMAGNQEVMATEEAEKAFKKAAATLGKYRKNKTLVPPYDLAGKYKKSFGELKQQLKDDLEAYLKACILEGMEIHGQAEAQKAAEAINALHKAEGVGGRVGRIAFGGCPPYRPGAAGDTAIGEVAQSVQEDMAKIQETAKEQRRRVWEEVYMPYLERRRQYPQGSQAASEKEERHGQTGEHKEI